MRLHWLSKIFGPRKSFSSADYWENRYAGGGNSGAGSYNKLSEFKSEILNQAFIDYGISRVTEFGCGDGHQLSMLRVKNYIGLDVSGTAIKNCTRQYQSDPSKSFFLYETGSAKNNNRFLSEAAISIDVIFHLVEFPVFENYLGDLFHCASKLVIIYGADLDHRQTTDHELYRKFTGYIELNFPEWKLDKKIPNRFPSKNFDDQEGSLSDFYFYTRK